jgi:hypothetical protein
MRIIFEINGKKYEVRKPTIRDYYKIQNELVFNQTPGFYLISLLSSCPEQELRGLSVDEFNELWESFEIFYSLENDPNFTLQKVISLGGKEYGMIQMDKMTIGEFADLDILLNSNKSESSIHEVLAILYREIVSKTGEKYVLAPYDFDSQKERAEIFLDLPISVSRGILGFFLLSALQSIKVTMDSLEKDPETKTNLLAQETLKTLKGLLEPGSILLSFLPEEIHSSLTKHQASESTQHSTSLPLSKTKPKQQNSLLKKLFTNISAN